MANAQVWLSMRQEAKAAAEKEPLLVSFVYSTILNQKTLEAAVAFHLANKANDISSAVLNVVHGRRVIYIVELVST